MMFDDEFIGTRAIVTISGFPKDNNLVHLQNVVREVNDAVQGELDDVEIGVVHDAANISMANGVNGGDMITEEDLEELSTAGSELGFDHKAMLTAYMASTAITLRVGAVGDQLSEIEEASKTPEEKSAEAQAAEARYAKRKAEDHQKMVKQRNDEIDHAHNVAEKWIERFGLNDAERVHGAVAEMLDQYGSKPKSWEYKGETKYDDTEVRAWPNTPGQAYAESYSRRYAKDIDERRMKLAKDLFGE